MVAVVRLTHLTPAYSAAARRPCAACCGKVACPASPAMPSCSCGAPTPHPTPLALATHSASGSSAGRYSAVLPDVSPSSCRRIGHVVRSSVGSCEQHSDSYSAQQVQPGAACDPRAKSARRTSRPSAGATGGRTRQTPPAAWLPTSSGCGRGTSAGRIARPCWAARAAAPRPPAGPADITAAQTSAGNETACGQSGVRLTSPDSGTASTSRPVEPGTTHIFAAPSSRRSVRKNATTLRLNRGRGSGKA